MAVPLLVNRQPFCDVALTLILALRQAKRLFLIILLRVFFCYVMVNAGLIFRG